MPQQDHDAPPKTPIAVTITLGLAMPLYDDIVGQTFGSLTADELEGLNAAVKHLNRLVDHLESKPSVTATRAPAAKARAHG